MDTLLYFILLFLLVGAVAADIRTYRIPNLLTLGGAVIGLFLSGLTGYVNGHFYTSLTGSVSGFLLLITITFPCYVFRILGAGDVKLLGCVGAFLGLKSGLTAFVATLLMGGFLSLVIAVAKGRFLELLKNIQSALVAGQAGWLTERKMHLDIADNSVAKMPYSVAIFLGVLITPLLSRYI